MNFDSQYYLLSHVIKDPKQKKYIKSDQITFNYCSIQVLDNLPQQYIQIQRLYLSHNLIKKLPNLRYLQNLTYLSIAYNQLDNHQDIISCSLQDQLTHLQIKGNPFETHPNSKQYMIDYFIKLIQLDDFKINEKLRFQARNFQITLQQNLIPMVYGIQEMMYHLQYCQKKIKLNVQFLQQRQKLVQIQWHNYDFTRIDQYLKKINKIMKQNRIQNQLINLVQLDKWDLDQDQQYIQSIFRELMSEILHRYQLLNDKQLYNHMIKNILNYESVDKKLLRKDQKYAQNCIVSEFYSLNYPRIQQQNYLSEFPIFPYNQNYINILNDLLQQKIQNLKLELDKIKQLIVQYQVNFSTYLKEEKPKISQPDGLKIIQKEHVDKKSYLNDEHSIKKDNVLSKREFFGVNILLQITLKIITNKKSQIFKNIQQFIRVTSLQRQSTLLKCLQGLKLNKSIQQSHSQKHNSNYLKSRGFFAFINNQNNQTKIIKNFKRLIYTFRTKYRTIIKKLWLNSIFKLNYNQFNQLEQAIDLY